MNELFSQACTKGERITPDEFGRRFDAAWETLQTRFFKFEGAQFYDEGPDGPYQHFIAGNLETLARTVVALRQEDAPFIREVVARGVNCTRLHALEHPISEYVQYEFYSYVLSEALGEKIFTTDIARAREVCGVIPPDFIIFDDRLLFIQHYDAGVLRDVDCITDPDVIRKISAMADDLLQSAHSFHMDATLDASLVRTLLAAIS